MDGILKFFDSGRERFELPGQVTVDCPANLRIEVNSDGILPYMSSSVFISCFATNTRTACPIPVPVKFTWYHAFDSLKLPLANKSGSHFVSALDLGFELRVEIESLETEHPGTAVVTIGPIQAAPAPTTYPRTAPPHRRVGGQQPRRGWSDRRQARKP